LASRPRVWLSYDGAVDVALKCKKLPENYGFVDIDVESIPQDMEMSRLGEGGT